MVPIKIQCDCGQKYAFDVEPVNGRMPSAVTCPVCGADGTPAANMVIAQQVPWFSNAQPSPQIRLISTPNGAPTPPPMPALPPVLGVAPVQPRPAIGDQPIPAAAPAQPGPVRLAPATMQPTPAPAPVPPAPAPVRLAPATTQLTTAPAAAAPAAVRLAPAASQPAAPTIHVAPAAPRPAAPAARSTRVDPRLGLVDHDQAAHEARAKMLWGDSQQDVVMYLLVQGWDRAEATELVQELFKERTATIRANGIRKMIIGTGLMLLPVVTIIVFLMIHLVIIYLLGASVVAGLYGVWLFLSGLLMAISPKSEKADAMK